MSNSSFKSKQYFRVESLIKESEVFNGDTGNGVFRSKTYPFILQNANNNLLSTFREPIKNYFQENGISWWNGRLTNHPLSSQVACLNHLFPLRDNKNAVLEVIRNVCPDIEDVLLIPTDQHSPAYIQFEAVSDNDHLNEAYSTRGSNCTSVDALIYGVHKDGRKILFPIEWKYVEVYSNEKKAEGNPEHIRKSRYTDLINKSEQLRDDCHSMYYYEPFYQLMRQTLWAEQMLANHSIETIKADDFIHVHVIPDENSELLGKLYPVSNKGMEETWRSCIKNQNRYVIISPKMLLSTVDKQRYGDVLDYLNLRYW